MNAPRQFLLVSAAVVVLGVCAYIWTTKPGGVSKPIPTPAPTPVPVPATAAAVPKPNCAGVVTDADGHPVAGATVEYWRGGGNPFLEDRPDLQQQITTGASGAFEFTISREAGFLFARKPGLAPAWRQLGWQYNQMSQPGDPVKLVLAPPSPLAGTVVDEAGKPLAQAAVSVVMAMSEISPDATTRMFNYLSGQTARDEFVARTDAAGHFRIDNFPTNATAMLSVKSPGKALRSSPPEAYGYGADPLPWRSGQGDIQLVVEPAGVVAGKILVAESNQPPPVARLTLQPDGQGFFAADEPEPVFSGADGSFLIGDVPAGSYRVRAVFGTNTVPDWVADTVPVSVEVGQTVRGVEVTASRGGLLEVAVLRENDRQPIPQVMVNAYRDNFPSAAHSDSNGLAFLRLPPGDYQIAANRESMPSTQMRAAVEAGRTNRVEIEMPAPKTVTGIVRQPDGRPAAGVTVRMVGGFGATTAGVKTDADGKFELEWNPRQFPQMNATTCILVRDAERNLAAAQDLDEDTGPLDLKLGPGLTLAGRVESDGKPVTNATASLIFHAGRIGMWLPGLARVTGPGQFEISALPPGREYGLVVSAPGYGQKMVNNIDSSAAATRQELDPFELKPANLKLAGRVLDADDQPVAGAQVNLNGDGQPNGHVSTDHQGRFRFEQVCAGPAQLMASARNSYGNVSAEGGDTNVVLRLGQSYNNQPGSVTHKLKGVVTDPGGQPVAGVRVAVFPFNNAPWVKTGADGAYSLTWSLQPWQLQNNSALLLVARDPEHNLAATEELTEELTNLDVKLKPALTVVARVQGSDGAALTGAQVGVWLRVGNSLDNVEEPAKSADVQGVCEIKCLPPDGRYTVYATATGHGRSEQTVQSDADTNRVELPPLILKLADQVLAGQVLNANDKPVSGANVNLNGEGQPNGNMTTDSKGRFHFKVCEGTVRLFASAQGGFGQVSATAGDTNVVLTLGSQSGGLPQAPHRASLKGAPLPDLTSVNLPAAAAPAGQPVLLCLFDAGQRPSRHVVNQLAQQAAALQNQNMTLLGVQAVVITDDVFNAWKTASPVAFPVGRVPDKSDKVKWATTVPALPWFILADASHRVVAEGFPLDEVDAQVKKLAASH